MLPTHEGRPRLLPGLGVILDARETAAQFDLEQTVALALRAEPEGIADAPQNDLQWERITVRQL